jgi:DHA2 family multidrug resistance protein
MVQGFIGGAMIPTVFATAFTIFPRSRMGLITPLIGLVATLAPTIGPTVGGYLTDTLSWHWLFFINIGPGIVVTLVTFALIDFDRPDFRLFEQFDWSGLMFMAGFLGALEYVLEEGPRNDWFGDETVLIAAWVSGLPPSRSSPASSRRVSRSSISGRSRTAISRWGRCSPSCSASASTA